MGILVARFDEEKTGKKKNGAETIQRRIQTRKLGDGNQWGKMSGISIRIKKTHRTKGTSATTAKVLFSNLRCMKCIATKRGLPHREDHQQGDEQHFRQAQVNDRDLDDGEHQENVENLDVLGMWSERSMSSRSPKAWITGDRQM